MSSYFALIDRTPDLVGVVVPDCPGCYAAGATVEEAMDNASEALDEWLADRLAAGFAPPPARSVEALQADASLAEEFATGSLLALVPAGIAEGRPTPAFDRNLMAQVSAAAKRDGISVSAFLAAAARDKLAQGR